MSSINNRLFEKDVDNNKVMESFSKYLANWPLFLFWLVICIGGGLLYARYIVPKYAATTKFLVRENESANKNSGDIIDAALSGKTEVNLYNEILLISSSSLMERTVAKNGFNISYFKKGKLLTIDVYQAAPFRLIGETILDSNRTYELNIYNLNKKGGKFKYGVEEEEKEYIFQWNEKFTIDDQIFELTPVVSIISDDGNYIARWQPIKSAAREILSNLVVRPYETKTSVIEVFLKSTNLNRGKDILNALYKEFNLSDIEDRNKLSDRTVRFIDERLIGITDELRGVEGTLENYQNSQQLVDVRSQSDQSLNNSSDVSKTLRSIKIQEGLVQMISDYFTNSENSSKLVPSSLGLNDPTLGSLIAKYNELKLKKERETPLIAPNSPIMQDLNMQIINLRSSIIESLNNISKNLQLQESNFKQQNSQYKSFLSSLPRNERILQEIKRKQNITEGLYLYLLQKREEAAISRTAYTVENYKQIDPAVGYGPIEPNTKNIVLSTTLLGLFIAFGGIYIREMLNNKVLSLNEITDRVEVPFLGEINQVSRRKLKVIAVGMRSIISEQFRAIRTNLSFMLKQRKNQVILITSSQSGEGKSFVSLNLAVVMATNGRKVALLEFDIRKPVFTSNLNLRPTYGLSDFLSGQTDDLQSMINTREDAPGLDIYTAGTSTTDVADLLLSDHLGTLINSLKEDYDYIVIDTPPAGLLRDALILAHYSDLVLYIVRPGHTLKRQLAGIDEFISHNDIFKVGVIANGVRKGQEKGYSGYEKYFNQSVKQSSRVKRETEKTYFQ